MMPATNAQENEMDDQTPFISSADPLLARGLSRVQAASRCDAR